MTLIRPSRSDCTCRGRHIIASISIGALLLVAATVPGCARHDAEQPIPAKLLHVPDWARDAVWYQIFPERFRNGDPSNDPTADDLAVSFPFKRPKDWRISKWTGDWYEMQPWEKQEGKKFYDIVFQRRYGGDLQGVLDRLDYLRDLGVTALYFNPLFESPSLHKYDASTYHHIDNNFGPDPTGDAALWAAERPEDPATWQWTAADKLFLKVVEEAHHRGMHVIIDGVFNHVGTTFWAFRDIREKGQASKFKDWFTVTSWDNPATPADEFDYRGWIGLKDLPEWREDDGGLVAGPRDYIHTIVRRWMDPNGDGNPSDGIDGWRLDVADMVGFPFWRQFRQWTREINPESYLTGEIWWEDWSHNKMFNGEPWLRGDVFDAVMNYRWAAEAMHFFRDRKMKTSATEFAARLDALRSDYRPEVSPVLMDLYSSHDTDRMGSMMVNRDLLFDHGVSTRDNPDYDVRKPNAEEIRRQKLMVLFQMTYVGAPMVYYGEEAGMWGGDDPDERKPMLWPEMTFDPEVCHPLEKARPRDVVAFDSVLFNAYRSLMRLRTAEPALRRGAYRMVSADNAQDALAFERSLGNDRLLIILNNGESCTLSVPLAIQDNGTRWTDLQTNELFVADKSALSVPLARVAGRLLKLKR
jgi:cyclomaltodextrinase / maltogenic alpha-amylase / neopullulanase